MAKNAYSKQELASIMTEVTAAVDEVLAKSESAKPATVQKNENCPPMAKAAEGASVQDAQDKKAQGGQMTKADEDPSAPKSDSGSSESASSPPAASPSPSPDASASAPAASPSPAPDASASADPAAAAGAPSLEQLKAAYDQLSPDEKNMHMQALQASLQASAAAPQASPAAPPAASPSPSPAAPAPGPDAAAPMPADQSQGVSPEFAMKSEQLNKKIEGLEKSLNIAVDALNLVLSQPKMKSITGDDVLNKGEPAFNVESLSKSEITDRLNAKVKSENLSKADRELVKGFYNGQKTRRDIAHLVVTK